MDIPSCIITHMPLAMADAMQRVKCDSFYHILLFVGSPVTVVGGLFVQRIGPLSALDMVCLQDQYCSQRCVL